jgi:hypothetical protein
MEFETLCECGCGQTAPIATKTDASNGRVKGQSMRFCVGHNGFLRPTITVCPQGHKMTPENTRMVHAKGFSVKGTPYRQQRQCIACALTRQRAWQASVFGRVSRALGDLKRAGLPVNELLRAKDIMTEFFNRPITEQVCPICSRNCAGKQQSAADHCHTSLTF